MVASAVYIMDVKGKIIISRNYRGDVPSSAAIRYVSFAKSRQHPFPPPKKLTIFAIASREMDEEEITSYVMKRINMFFMTCTFDVSNNSYVMLMFSLARRTALGLTKSFRRKIRPS